MNKPTDLNASSAPGNPAQAAQSQDPYAEIGVAENSPLGAAEVANFKQMAAAVKLPAEALQQWLSYEENRLQQTAQRTREEQAHWARQTQALFGSKWQEEISKAVRAANAFGGEELRQLLEKTGLGNHPVIVRTFYAVAQRMSEDVSPGGAPSATTDKTFTQALYGKE